MQDNFGSGVSLNKAKAFLVKPKFKRSHIPWASLPLLMHHSCYATNMKQLYSLKRSGPTKHRKEHKETRDPFAIRVTVKAAYLSSVIVIMSLEAK